MAPSSYNGKIYTTSGTNSTDGNMGTGGITDFDPVELHIGTEWVEATTKVFHKRRRLFGRKDVENSDKEAKVFFEILKDGLKKQEKKKFEELAEKAFELALKHGKMGQEDVKKELEERMGYFLKKAAIKTKGYNTYVDEDIIDEYRDHLPNDKALIIDALSEYDDIMPEEIQDKLCEAKDDKVFDAFFIFWIKDVPDPILFGQIDEESDVFYYIVEWDEDISIEDLLKYESASDRQEQI